MSAQNHSPSVSRWGPLVCALALLSSAAAWAQSSTWPQSSTYPQQSVQIEQQAAPAPVGPWVVIPQLGAYAPAATIISSKAGPVSPETLQVVEVKADIAAQEARVLTSLDVSIRNPHAIPVQAVLLVPVPSGARPAGGRAELMAGQGAWSRLTDLVERTRDPALMEFAGLPLIRSVPFEIPAGGLHRARLEYAQELQAVDEQLDLYLPRPEILGERCPWRISVALSSERTIAAVYSPSHAITARRTGAGAVAVAVSAAADTPGPFRLSWQRTRAALATSLFAYPEPGGGGGFFMLVADAPPAPAGQAPAIRREVSLVIDRSGSMSGQKLEQVRAAAKRMLAGLADGEAFNLIAYNEKVDVFAARSVVKTGESLARAEAWLDDLRARGGTDLHAGLEAALAPPPTRDSLPIVLFLTDGLPTVGQTSERAIRSMVADHERTRRRIFTFGVGVDVNTPLLEAIASQSRAAATFVLPGQDVGAKVDRVFAALSGPVLADPVLRAAGVKRSRKTRGPIFDLLPTRTPDLFEDDQLIVLGRYRGGRPIKLELAGNFRGRWRIFRTRLDPARARPGFGFVPRLWASRKIATLVDRIRASGADADRVAFEQVPAQAQGYPSSMAQAQQAPSPARDSRFSAWVAEAVRLSRTYGVLTEYTAFIAGDGVDLGRAADVVALATDNFERRAVQTRSGLSSVNQDYNKQAQAKQMVLNPTNTFYDAKMNPVSTTRVQQVADLAFFLKGGLWIDSRLLSGSAGGGAREVRFGTAGFWELARALVDQQRQAALALPGRALIEVNGQAVMVLNAR